MTTIPFQTRVFGWMRRCFTEEVAVDSVERNHRFFEEATELVQANSMSRAEAHQLVDYVFDRPAGEQVQEAGGVMVTLAALLLTLVIDMDVAAEQEFARIDRPETIEKIRAKQAGKIRYSALPEPTAADPLRPNLTLLVKLGSIARHIEEALGKGGHAFDVEAIKPLLADPYVVRWFEGMDAMAFLPRMR